MTRALNQSRGTMLCARLEKRWRPRRPRGAACWGRDGLEPGTGLLFRETGRFTPIHVDAYVFFMRFAIDNCFFSGVATL